MASAPPDSDLSTELPFQLGLGELTGILHVEGIIPGQQLKSALRLAAGGGLFLLGLGGPLLLVDAFRPLGDYAGPLLTVVIMGSVLGGIIGMVRLMMPHPVPFVVTPHRLAIGPWTAEASQITAVLADHWTTPYKRKVLHHHAIDVQLRTGTVRFRVAVDDAATLDALVELVGQVLRKEPPSEVPPALRHLMGRVGSA